MPNRKNKRVPTINVEMRMPIVARVMTGRRSFRRLFASICMEPANKRKPSMLFISTSWKSIEVMILISEVDGPGNNAADVINRTEKAKDRAMIPMVGGHLIYLWLTKENNAARQIIKVNISYDHMGCSMFYIKANEILKLIGT